MKIISSIIKGIRNRSGNRLKSVFSVLSIFEFFKILKNILDCFFNDGWSNILRFGSFNN